MPCGVGVRKAVISPRDLPVDRRGVGGATLNPCAAMVDRGVRTRNRSVCTVLRAAIEKRKTARGQAVRLPENASFHIEEVR